MFEILALAMGMMAVAILQARRGHRLIKCRVVTPLPQRRRRR
jgi:hypothetical protein